jgi:hypothetical protein
MGISRVLKRFNVPFDIIRQPPIVREKGRVKDAGGPELLPGMGGIQPAGPKDLQRLPEGQRTDAAIVIFTDLDLLTGDAPDTQADHVIPRAPGVYCGVEFEIQSVEPWPRHRKYLAVKVGQ